jgi:hypothetical protein
LNGLGTIGSGAGLQDGLNPCIFMACTVFITLVRTVWLRVIFVLIYALGLFEFDFGPAQVLILRKEFIFAAKIIYLVLGVGAFILGMLFLKDWFLLNRGLQPKEPADVKTKPSKAGELAACLTTVILAAVLSALATLWPANIYVMVLGGEGLSRGQWSTILPLLTGYIFFSMWPLWFVWAFLGTKNLRPSLMKIICASIFFTASSCVIFMFK